MFAFYNHNFYKGCCLQEVRPEFCESLPQLKILDLRDNKITKIAEEILMLQQLIRLDLTNNELSRFVATKKTHLFTANTLDFSLPNTLALLPHLQNLQIDGNSLKQIRTDVIKGGTGRILRFLREKMDDTALNKTASTENVQKKQAFPHKNQLRSIRALNLPMKELTVVPDEVFDDARTAEVHAVDLSRNKLNCVPVG